MPIPLDRDPYNIRYSIQKWVLDNFDTPNTDYGVNYADVFFNADARGERRSAVRNLWVRVQFLRNLAGRKDFSLVQFDCYSRTGTRATDEDFGRQLALMVKALVDIFMVRSIPIYDFIADHTAPVVQDGNVIFAQSSGGKFGTPEDHVVAFWEGDTLREVVTMRFRTAYDLSPMESFDRGV